MPEYTPEIITVQTDKPYILKTNQLKKVKAPMQLALGRKGYNEFKIEGFDPVPIYAEMSKSAHWLYWTLMGHRDPKTNIAIFRNKELSEVERKKAHRAYKELENFNLLVRAKQETYLFNPKATLPMEGCYVEVWNRWFELRGSKA